jgi:hypothetical protein
VYGLHHAQGDEEHGFLRLSSKPGSMVCQLFGLKTGGDDFLQCGLKTGGDGFLQFDLKTKVVEGFSVGPQNRQLWFCDLGLKITVTVS